ncbi:MAG: LemA family protein [Gaiellales bacterium]
MTVVLIAIAAVVLLVVLWVVFLANRLIRLRNEAHQALSGIDIQLQRRADLIPNLVAVVKGYAAHESETFEAVTQSRAQLMAAQSVSQKGDAAAQTTAALGRLYAVAEAYPELKANEVFLKLQQQLTDIEDLLASARNYYNSVVRRYNTAISVFPTNLLAGRRFLPAEFFQGDAASHSGPPPVTT